MEQGTIVLNNRPGLICGAAVVGDKEGEGPLGSKFDYIIPEAHFGKDTWEQAETEMQSEALRFALDKSGITEMELEYILSGDLLNQCVASSFAHRASNTAYLGLYGACSTFVEGLALSAILIDGGYAQNAATCVSSHFCAAERQYRYPMEYGGQRTPTSQWTVTGAGCTILGKEGRGAQIRAVTIGKIVDQGICDVNNMGAAMAPAAYDTLKRIFTDTKTAPENFDLIITGDLGSVGSQLLCDLFRMQDHINFGANHIDCGTQIFDVDTQEVASGGSGAGCSATVFSAYLLKEIQEGRWKNVLFAGTGALLSPLTTQQGETIPCICHGIWIEGGM